MTGAAAGAEARLLEPERLPDHLDRLYRAARALCRSREEAEDLVQETCARVLSKPRFLTGDDDLGYLLRVLRNTWHTQHRTSCRRPSTVGAVEEMELLEDTRSLGPDELAAAREVYAAVARLPDPLREVVAAVDFAGLSYKEAARACRTKEGTVMSRLFRAREQVASLLGADA